MQLKWVAVQWCGCDGIFDSRIGHIVKVVIVCAYQMRIANTRRESIEGIWGRYQWYSGCESVVVFYLKHYLSEYMIFVNRFECN